MTIIINRKQTGNREKRNQRKKTNDGMNQYKQHIVY